MRQRVSMPAGLVNRLLFGDLFVVCSEKEQFIIFRAISDLFEQINQIKIISVFHLYVKNVHFKSKMVLEYDAH